MSDATSTPRVVILGGGFGGLEAAKALRRAPVHVTLIDRRNHHLFQPLLYQVATAGLSPEQIAFPIRSVLRAQPNTSVLMAEVTGVDRARRVVKIEDGRGEGEVEYDFLVVATGARHSYFGHPSWEGRAPGLKDVVDAGLIRERVLAAFEEAEAVGEGYDPSYWLTFVIVGGGPTGVELAGALAELAKRALRRDFRNIKPQETRVLLVEAGPRLLPAFPEELGARAKADLERLGVEVRVGARVDDVSPGGVVIDGRPLSTRTVVWAAGVEASPAARWLASPADRAGRVIVERDCSLPGHPEIFVIGDVAHHDVGGKPLPGVAPVAMQQGRHVARLIALEVAGRRDRRPFAHVDKGNLATIGRFRAVGEFKGVSFSGPLAWLIWAAVHIYYLIGFRNRYLVLTQWVFSYLTFQRGARLIARPAPEALELTPHAVLPARKPLEEPAAPAEARAAVPVGITHPRPSL